MVAPILIYGGKKMSKLDQEVLLVNKGEKNFVSKWNGKKVLISANQEKQLVRGLAQHFIDKHPEATLEIKEIEEEPQDPRTPEGTGEEDTGSAFAELDGELEDKNVKELKAIAKEIGIEGYSNLNKESLIEAIQEHEGE